ncbi:putative 6-phosphogluconolactonase 4 [Nymphaea thermarum]|nr:putative 6-phosphogluconolactonase 4 [Nymphaea thermarum]
MNLASTVSSGSISIPLGSIRRPVSRASVFRKSIPAGSRFPLLRPRVCKSSRTPENLHLKAHPPMAAETTAKGEPKLVVFGSEEELSESLAEYVSRLSEKFVEERGAFTLVLSGGSLIKTLRKLMEPPYLGSTKWSRWHVFWVDERVVPKDHPDSNYKLAYDAFLSKVPILPGNVCAINDSLSAEAAAEDYETGLRQLVKSEVVALSSESCFPKFDLILLGMGPDVTGSGKADTLRTALEDVDRPDPLPVQIVSPEGELTWFADKAASSLLQGSSSL